MNIETVKVQENSFSARIDGVEWSSISEGSRFFPAIQEWIAEGNTPESADPQPAPIITVSPWQFRKALNQVGLRQQVEDAVLASNDIEIKDGWEFATKFIESDPFVIAMATNINVDQAGLHDLFVLAESL